MAGRFPLYTDANGPVLIAERWHLEQRPFPGLVWWPREHYGGMTPGDFLEAFEELARQDRPFMGYPIIHIKPKR